MLIVRKPFEPFFHRKVFFSICSTGHLKRSSDKLAEGFWPKVQKGSEVFIGKKIPPIFSPDTRKALTNKMPKMSTQHTIKLFVRSTWTNKIFFQKLHSDFPFEHVESSFDFNTEFSVANSWKIFLKFRKCFSNHKRVLKIPQKLTLGTSNSVLTNLL